MDTELNNSIIKSSIPSLLKSPAYSQFLIETLSKAKPLVPSKVLTSTTAGNVLLPKTTNSNPKTTSSNPSPFISPVLAT